MIIAVTGITGHTGRYFIQELVQHKSEDVIRCLVREDSNTSTLDSSGLNIEKIIGDRENIDDVRRLLKGADRCMHISNIHQSPLVLQAAIDENVPRVVLVHTTGIFSKHKMASEEYKRIEKNVFSLIKGQNIDVTILRPTMIFGDQCDHNIHKFINLAMKLPVVPLINHGDALIQPVNARDLGKAYYSVIMKNHLPMDDYILSGDRPISMRDMFVMIDAFLGKKVRFIGVPMNIGVFMAKTLKVITHGKHDYIEKVLRMGDNRSFPHDAAYKDFGFSPEPFEDGLKREIKQMVSEVYA